jgi:hypothetical protein
MRTICRWLAAMVVAALPATAFSTTIAVDVQGTVTSIFSAENPQATLGAPIGSTFDFSYTYSTTSPIYYPPAGPPTADSNTYSYTVQSSSLTTMTGTIVTGGGYSVTINHGLPVAGGFEDSYSLFNPNANSANFTISLLLYAITASPGNLLSSTALQDPPSVSSVLSVPNAIFAGATFSIIESVPYGPGFYGTVTSISAQPVPLPASAWLMLSGLSGLGFLARRRSA